MFQDSIQYKGHCLCKAITFSIKEAPLTVSHCHCESCRRWQSAAFGTWASFSNSTFKLSGTPNTFTSSPGNHRQFCGSCGSPLFMICDNEPKIIYIAAASFESSAVISPTRHVSFEEKVDWDPSNEFLPKYEGKDFKLANFDRPIITKTYAKDMALYSQWQNEKLFEICDKIGESARKLDRKMFFSSIHNTLNHILTIDDAIFTFIHTGNPKHIDYNVFPIDSFEELKSARSNFDLKLLSISDQVEDSWFTKNLEFYSERLERTRKIPRAFMLMQLYNHQTHHRSQITSELHKIGMDYGSTDFPFNPYCEY